MRLIYKIVDFFRYFFINCRLIFELAKNDFKKRTAGSYFGVVWLYVQPMTTICLMWLVFSVGLKAQPIEEGVPFIVWLASGMIPWFFFSEAFINSSNSLIEYSFMLKQMAFRGSVLPLIKIISSSFVHVFLIGLLSIIAVVSKVDINIYSIQIIYYYACMLYLLLGLGWLFSSIRPFMSDVGEIISVAIQLGFWYTPIIWNINLVPEQYKMIFKLNPMYYIIQGYRDSLIYNISILDRTKDTILFFIITTIILLIGVLSFQKLRPHFNDVL